MQLTCKKIENKQAKLAITANRDVKIGRIGVWDEYTQTVLERPKRG
jgi:sRNA-binding carbon storage regulator CsrA